jgi:hypothetical protein
MLAMQQVTVRKQDLLAKLRENRKEHHNIFLEAQKSYREAAIKLLDQQLALARNGSPFMLSRIVKLAEPQDHTKDYDRAIAMLEMSVGDTITITAQEFANFVEDNWQWTYQWAASSLQYVPTSKKLREIAGA